MRVVYCWNGDKFTAPKLREVTSSLLGWSPRGPWVSLLANLRQRLPYRASISSIIGLNYM